MCASVCSYHFLQNSKKIQDIYNYKNARKMDACEAVEKELQRVITKFTGVHEHSKRMLGDVVKNFEDLKSSIEEGLYRFH